MSKASFGWVSVGMFNGVHGQFDDTMVRVFFFTGVWAADQANEGKKRTQETMSWCWSDWDEGKKVGEAPRARFLYVGASW